jgi:hypothetical protein
MTHEELLAIFSGEEPVYVRDILYSALRAVVELHKPQEITLPDGEWGTNCEHCDGLIYPCPTIQAIEKELK